jgi:hypothetical protein
MNNLKFCILINSKLKINKNINIKLNLPPGENEIYKIKYRSGNSKRNRKLFSFFFLA